MAHRIGAVGGATIDVIFIDHFQSLARGHFTVRRLVLCGAVYVMVRMKALVARSMSAGRLVGEEGVAHARSIAASMRGYAAFAVQNGLAATARIAVRTAERLERAVTAAAP